MTANKHHSSEQLRERAWAAAAQVFDPELRKPLTELGMLPEFTVSADGILDAKLELTIAGCPAAKQIEADLRQALQQVTGITKVRLQVAAMSPARRQEFIASVRGSKKRQFTPDSLTRVLAVSSGKGGVGKSSVTANLAAALAAQGFRVGLLDADVFGFSIPALLGITGAALRPTRVDDMILPPVAHGVKTISIGMFLGERPGHTTAISWRGPMLHRTLEQFLTDVFFGDLDFLLVDLPPGTGDIAISFGQLLPQAEFLVVTTPQPSAADVAVRSGILAHQSGQRIIGVVENMSFLLQPDGTATEIFGSGGGQTVAARLSSHTGYPVPLMAQLPLSSAFAAANESGTPPVLSVPQDECARELCALAQRLSVRPGSLAGRNLPLQTA